MSEVLLGDDEVEAEWGESKGSKEREILTGRSLLSLSALLVPPSRPWRKLESTACSRARLSSFSVLQNRDRERISPRTARVNGTLGRIYPANWYKSGRLTRELGSSEAKSNDTSQSGTQLSRQPDSRHSPISHYGLGRDLKHLCGFLYAKAAEETQLNHFRLSSVHRFQVD